MLKCRHQKNIKINFSMEIENNKSHKENLYGVIKKKKHRKS